MDINLPDPPLPVGGADQSDATRNRSDVSRPDFAPDYYIVNPGDIIQSSPESFQFPRRTRYIVISSPARAPSMASQVWRLTNNFTMTQPARHYAML